MFEKQHSQAHHASRPGGDDIRQLLLAALLIFMLGWMLIQFAATFPA